jgi:hypothetical protein
LIFPVKDISEDMSELDLKSPTSPSDISVAPTDDGDVRYCILPGTKETIITNYIATSLAGVGQETTVCRPLENKEVAQYRSATAKLVWKTLDLSTTYADS